MAAEWFADPERRELAARVDRALLSLNADWRVTPIERTTPLSGAGAFANLAERLGTLAYCYQIYCVTEEATCAHAVSVARTLAAALAGPEWEAAAPPPNIERDRLAALHGPADPARRAGPGAASRMRPGDGDRSTQGVTSRAVLTGALLVAAISVVSPGRSWSSRARS